MRNYFVIRKSWSYLLVFILILVIALAVVVLYMRFAPQNPSSPAIDSKRAYPMHTDIISTTFWVGEIFNNTLSDGSQVCSTYDAQWAYHWSGINHGRAPVDASDCANSIIGGCDGVVSSDGECETERRVASNNYFPSSTTPKENPFYLDIPYDDLNDPIAFAQRCQVIAWVNDPGYVGHCHDQGFSYMKNKFVRIIGPSGRVCYGQVQDAGPSHDDLYHDSDYVFGTNDKRPRQRNFNNAGMDVSPALNGCLGFADLNGQGDKIKWQFVDTKDVPDGPWKKIVTTSGVTR